MSAPNGATMTNMQPLPLPLLEVGLPLPTIAGLPLPTTVGLPCGATAGDPPVLPTAGAEPGGGGGWDVTGAALVGGGAGTDETWETCET
jgi:hypothetical protein